MAFFSVLMYGVYLLLLIPLLLNLLSKTTNAQILINIQASGSSDITATATGQSRTITKINANHKELFHITEQLLKNAVFKLSGQQTEVHIDDDSNGLFENYNLEPVGTLLTPNGTKLKVIKEEVILNRLQAFNHDAIAKTQVIKLTGNVEDNVTCIYKQKDVFPAVITHKIDIIGLGKSPSWNMKSTFGKDLFVTRVVPIANSSFTVNLEPKQDSTAILSATKVTAVIQVNYIVMLTGYVLAKFENSYIWGYENYAIETVMAEAGMPHSLMLREEITVQFYTDCAIKVYGEVYGTNDVNRCTFTTVDNKQEIPDLNWQTERQELEPVSLPSLKGGLGVSTATRTPTAVVLMLICLLMKIQIF